jgi:hypothetical protein
MTASELKSLYERNNPEGHYFERSTMRFFGDTMRNYYVVDAGEVETYGSDEKIPAWALCRRRPVKGGFVGLCAHFAKDDGRILCVKEQP